MKRARSFRTLPAGLVGLAVICGTALATVGGCPSQSSGTDSTVDVSIAGQAFVPKEITIQKGQTVRWTNNDNTVHAIVSGSPEDLVLGQILLSGDLSPGQTFSHTFEAVGEVRYFCSHHPTTMRDAKVIVEDVKN